LLEGTLVDTNIQGEAYVLGMVDGEVGLYKAAMEDGVWLNNANKAYLPATAAMSAASYSFRFPGTTAIESADENGEAKVVYDLNGRRVQTAPVGKVYIQDGVKKFNK
jgi:hypothetical protein